MICFKNSSKTDKGSAHGPSHLASSGLGWASKNNPAIDCDIPALAKLKTNSLLPPVALPKPPGSWSEWVTSNITGLANFLSRTSRKKNSIADEQDIPLEKEHHYQFALNHAATSDTDFYIFGHRHKPIDVQVGQKSRLINLGDWVTKFTYAEWDGKNITLHTYHN